MISTQQYGPWAVIAGGSEGVGESFARLLARAGFNLVLVARRVEPLERLAGKLRTQTKVQVRIVPVDLTLPNALDVIRHDTDELDVGLLICNAGAERGAEPFLDRPVEHALRLLDLNAGSQIVLSHHFGARMKDRGRGGIILVGSGGGTAGCANLAVYSGVKAFTQIFGEGLWAELSPIGVDVLVMVLGRTQTPALALTELADSPGTPAADPDDMAQLALDNLQNGPVYAPPNLQPGLQHLRSLPRDEAVAIMSRSTSNKK
jgi:short-subunit dehydrogenase